MRARRPDPQGAEYEEWRRSYFRGATSGILSRLAVDVEVVGEFPDRGGILVTNHLGYLDVLVLASLGPTVFVSRADVENWPLIGRLTRWCSTIFIDRSRRDQIPAVIAEMREALGTGAQVVFFPEGTSGSGEKVMPFRPSLFGVAVDGAFEVRAAVLGYSTGAGEPSARDAVCWWGDAGFAPHFFILAGLREVRARVEFIPGHFSGVDRKELAGACEAAIRERFIPVTGSEAD